MRIDQGTKIRFGILIILILLVSPAFALWTDVVPSIHEKTIDIYHPERGVDLSRYVLVSYPDDYSILSTSLTDLEYRLADRGCRESQFIRTPIDQVEVTGRIYIGRWQHMENIFADHGWQAPGDEDYYIKVDTVAKNLYITASTTRGFNYAIESVDQAMNERVIENGLIKDYPDFPQRKISYFTNFDNNNDGFWGHGTSPWTSDVADTLLQLARNIMMRGKANGVIHEANPTAYSDGSNGEENIVTILERIGNPPIGSNNHVRKWADYHFDWTERMNWQSVGGANDNSLDYYGRIRVQKRCKVDSVYGGRTYLKVVPLRPAWYFAAQDDSVGFSQHENTGFDRLLNGHLLGWVDGDGSNSERGGTSPDYYCHWESVSAGGMVKIRKDSICFGQIEPDEEFSSSPTRQMLLRFKVRGGNDSLKVYVDLHLDPHWARHYPDHTSDDIGIVPPPDTEDQVLLQKEAVWLIKPKDIVPVLVDTSDHSGSGWKWCEVLFNTLGAKKAAIELRLKNGSRLPSSIDLDDVTFFDSDIYDVYPATQIDDSIRIYDNLGAIHRLPSSALQMEERRTQDAVNWRIHHAKPYLSTDTLTSANCKYIEIDYWSGIRKPMYYAFNSLIPSLPHPIEMFQSGVRLARVDQITGFATTMRNQMNWFNTWFQGYNSGLMPEGYYCKENEIQAAGWSNEARLLGTTCEAQYGAFLSSMVDSLPSLPNTVPHLTVWGDMFDPYHNGLRFFDFSNPYTPFMGWKRTEANPAIIPGVGLSKRLTYIMWQVHQDGEAENASWNSLNFWKNISASNGGNSDVIIGLGSPNNDMTEVMYNARHYEDLMVNARRFSREDSARFSGGLLFRWYERKTTNVNNDWFYPFSATDTVGRGQWLWWMWKSTPEIWHPVPFNSNYASNQPTATTTIKAYPIPYRVSDTHVEMDSVVLQYRIHLSTGDLAGNGWQTQTILNRSKLDSLYQFTIELPDEGGFVEYRTWAFDDFGSYCSVPDRGTKLKYPDAGERYYFTFERRKTTPITDGRTFYTPGIISQTHVIGAGGHLTISPLPGYHSSTMYIGGTQAGFSLKSIGLLTVMPELHISGLDTSAILFKFTPGVSSWGGIQDSAGKVKMENVKFLTGAVATSLSKIAGDSAFAFSKVTFEGPIIFNTSGNIVGEVQCGGIIVDSSSSLTVQPGSVVSFSDSARLMVQNGGKLIAVSSVDSLPIQFKSTSDSTKWLGLQIGRSASDSSQLTGCVISGATAGLLTDRRTVNVANCKIEKCQSGMVAINGGKVNVSDSRLSSNADGVTLMNLSTLQANNSQISGNTGTGILALSRSTVNLNQCVVDSNGGDGTAGGLGLFTGSTGVLNCTAIDNNYGSGLTSYGGAVVLNSVDSAMTSSMIWHGNSVYGNHTVPGEAQVTLRGRVGFGLYNGYNRIADSIGTGKLVNWSDHPTRDWWRDTYWGTTDTATILSRLPASVLLSRVASNWTSCPTFQIDGNAPDSLAAEFINPFRTELAQNYTDARSTYQSNLQTKPKSDWAMAVSDRLLNLDLASGSSFNTERTYLQSIVDATSDASLKRWLKNGIGWCWAEVDSFGKANSVYDTLSGTSNPRLDQINAKVQKQMVAVRKLPKDSTLFDATKVLAYVDTVRAILLQANRWTQSEITDSVVMYAPCYVDTSISIYANAKLYIKVHPGVQNAVAHFSNGSSICVGGGNNQGIPGGQLWIQGETGNPLVMDSRSDTVWAFLNVYGGRLEMINVKSMGRGICTDAEQSSSIHAPILHIDSCQFSIFDDGIYFLNTDTSSYIRNSLLDHVGRSVGDLSGYGAGIGVIDGAHASIENCEIRGGDGLGLFNYFSGTDAHLTGTNIHDNASNGILSWEGGNLDVECSELSSNGDTLPELEIEDGYVNMSSGHNVVSDSAGDLIFASDPAMVDLGDGENKFELYSGTGKYLNSGTPTATWDISMNTWSPVDPSSSNFYSMLYPTTQSKWLVDSSLASFIACGEGGTASIGLNRYIIPGDHSRGNSESQSFVQEGGSDGGSAASGLKGGGVDLRKENTPSSLAIKSSQLRKSDSHQELVQLHHAEANEWKAVLNNSKNQGQAEAARATMAFIQGHATSSILPNALVKLSGYAGKGTDGLSISEFLANQSRTLSDPHQQSLAGRLSSVALSREGKPAEALRQLETQMESATTDKDSIRALVDAMGVYFFNRHSKDVVPRNANIRSATLPEMVHKVTALISTLHGTPAKKGSNSAPIPTAYKLYQNYPNPFNPNTEICFDLPEAVRVELKVFNILGQEVANLVDQVRAAGAYRIMWDSKSATGTPVASGMYVYQIKAGKFTDAKKMMLIR